MAAAVRGQRFVAPTVSNRPSSPWAAVPHARVPAAMNPARVLDNSRTRRQLHAGRQVVSPSVYYGEQGAIAQTAIYRNNPAILARLPLRAGLPERRIFAGLDFPVTTPPPRRGPILTLIDRLLGRA
jgi:hypothetical protein